MWRLLQSLCIESVNFVVQVVLARLLIPADFGIIAMVWVIIAIMETFITSGFGYALIQRHKVTRVDECSVFYFNVIVSIICCMLLWLLAPYVSRFYGQPAITLLMRILSLQLIIGAFGHIQLSLLAKQIDFKTQFRVGGIASVMSGIVGIIMAFLGFGVWSIVAQQLSRVSVCVALAWCYSKWRPAWLFSFRSLLSMFTFGSNMLFAALVETAYLNIYSAVIGKLFSPAGLGFYSRARRLQELPSQSFTSVVAGVAFPVFSLVQKDRTRLRNGLRTCLGLLAMLVFPAMLGLAIVAKHFVLLVLTEKWLPCVPYLQMLCIVGALYPFYALYEKVLLAIGESGLFFRLHLLNKGIVVLSIIVMYRWGIMGLIYGQVVVSIISTLLIAHIAGKKVEYQASRLLADVLPCIVLSGVVGIFIYITGLLPFPNNAWLLLSQVVVAFVVSILYCKILNIPAFILITRLVKDYICSNKVEESVGV